MCSTTSGANELGGEDNGFQERIPGPVLFGERYFELEQRWRAQAAEAEEAPQSSSPASQSQQHLTKGVKEMGSGTTPPWSGVVGLLV